MILFGNFRKVYSLTVLIATFLLLLSTNLAQAEIKLPEPRGYVNDFANMLSNNTQTMVENKLRDYEKKTTNEIAVVTVKTLQETTIEDYASRLFEKWKIGKKDKDNGILLLIAQKERKMRIEVGYGLEGTLTDAEAYGIIVNTIRPAFREGNFDNGVEEGINQIIKGASGAALPEGPLESEEEKRPVVPEEWYILFGILAIMVVWLGAILARTKSWWAGGVIGIISSLVAIPFFGFLVGFILLLVLPLFGLGLDYFVSRKYQSSFKKGQKPPWWSGGGWAPGWWDSSSTDTTDTSSSNSFGGSDDGFGGGESGGGGASGDW